MARRLLGFLLGLLLRLWLWTLRFEFEFAPELARVADRRWVYVFWHGQQVGLLRCRTARAKAGRRCRVLVSWSRDGDLQTGVMTALGFEVVRGSSSRGGARGYRQMVEGDTPVDLAFAVDGPRGPRGKVKSGAIRAAGQIDGCLVPAASWPLSARRLERAWDRFEVPLPFSRVRVALGPPLPGDATREDVARAIELARSRARSDSVSATSRLTVGAPGDTGFEP